MENINISLSFIIVNSQYKNNQTLILNLCAFLIMSVIIRYDMVKYEYNHRNK